MHTAGDVGAFDEETLLAGLRAGDERCFVWLVDRHSPALLRLARQYVSSRAVAEEVVQDTWLAVLRGLDGFEGRSTLRTWLFRILVNRARSRGTRERRTVPFAPATDLDRDPFDGALPTDRFRPSDAPRLPGWWAVYPQAWPEVDVGSELDERLGRRLHDALGELSPAQREIVLLRDVEGWSAEEVSDALQLSAGNVRTLLHRARSRLRAALEAELVDE